MQYEASGFLSAGAAAKSIKESQFNQVKLAKRILIAGVELEEKISMTLDNYHEFEVELLSQAQSLAIRSDSSHESAMRNRLTLDRRVANLLSACRLYLDHSDHIVSGIFGNPSDELTQIKDFKRALYDAHFEYRLMEALRNHVQHAGLPIHIYQKKYKALNDRFTHHQEISIVPKIKPSTLDENGSFKKSVLTELESKGDDYDVRAAIKLYISHIVEVHLKVVEIISKKFRDSRKCYKDAIDAFS